MAIFAGAAVTLPGSQAAEKGKLKITQPTCGKFKGGEKKQCETNARVREILGDRKYFGTLANGEPIDVIYCLNGAVADDVRLNSDPMGIGWKVTSAEMSGKKSFTAIVRSKKGKADFDRSISRQGKNWKLGTVSKKGRPVGLRPVERTSTVIESESGDRNLCDEYGTELELPAPESEDD